MTFGVTLGRHLMMVASPNIFYVAIDYKNKTYMEVAATSINMKIHQLFSKHENTSAVFLVSSWPLYSGESRGSWHELAFE